MSCRQTMELWFLQEIMLWFDKPKQDLLED